MAIRSSTPARNHRAIERLDVDLLPNLEYTARPQFLRGDYETAAFTAMKQGTAGRQRRLH